MESSLKLAQSRIDNFFDTVNKKIYKHSEIKDILGNKRAEWNLPSSVRLNGFIDFLLRETKLKKVGLSFITRPELRYAWGDVSVFELGLSLKDASYLSHQTAAYLNGLTDYPSKNVYVNSEQRPRGKGTLSQDGINLAFKNPVRVTKSHAQYGDKTIWLLNGMNTNCNGVIEKEDSNAKKIRLTNVERTLIDLAVRPVYSGGVSEVLNAYKLAKDKLSIERLVETLRLIDFTYPYHQVIGFYLEKAGCYEESLLEVFRKIGLEYDFYLTHKMDETLYSKRWRLYYPKDL
jgi:hypothetical protein